MNNHKFQSKNTTKMSTHKLLATNMYKTKINNHKLLVKYTTKMNNHKFQAKNNTKMSTH